MLCCIDLDLIPAFPGQRRSRKDDIEYTGNYENMQYTNTNGNALKQYEPKTKNQDYLSVTVPPGVSPGQEIQVAAPDGRMISVVVPQFMGPGSKFTVAFPSSESSESNPADDPVATTTSPPPPSPTNSNKNQHLSVKVPEGVNAGQEMRVAAPDGRMISVIVPQFMGPGSTFMVAIPPLENPLQNVSNQLSPKNNLLSVTVPDGVNPGQEIRVSAPDGRMITAVVPEGMKTGSTFMVSYDK